jgi:hypothetical protein
MLLLTLQALLVVHNLIKVGKKVPTSNSRPTSPVTLEKDVQVKTSIRVGLLIVSQDIIQRLLRCEYVGAEKAINIWLKPPIATRSVSNLRPFFIKESVGNLHRVIAITEKRG